MHSTRVDWTSLPSAVRAQVTTALGADVAAVVPLAGGFSPGFLAHVNGVSGGRVFVKLCSVALNPRTPTMHLDEAAVLRLLPSGSPSPRLVASVADPESGWSGLITSFVDGRECGVTHGDAVNSFATIATIAALEPPPQLRPLHEVLRDDFLWFGVRRLLERDGAIDGWSTQRASQLLSLESDLPAALEGRETVHGDMRADNVLVQFNGEAIAVDWPAAAIGNSAFDVVMLCASIAEQGGPPPAELLAISERCRMLDHDLITTVIVGLYGHYAWACTLGDPPGIPRVRAYQASMAATLRKWLTDR
jgi:hypothetical protein